MMKILFGAIIGCFFAGSVAAQDANRAVIAAQFAADVQAAYAAELQQKAALSEPTIDGDVRTVIIRFCAQILGRDLSRRCDALGDGTVVDDPLRLARAVSYAQGTWKMPDGDDASIEALRKQVYADTQVLRNAVARASRRDGTKIALTGPALQIVPDQAGPTIAELFPDGIGTDDKALDRAFVTIMMAPRLSPAEREGMIATLRDAMGIEDQPEAPRANLSGLVGNPLQCDDMVLPPRLRPFEQVTITLPEALHGIDDLSGYMLSETHDQQVLLERTSMTEAQMILPMHPNGSRGGEVGLVFMFAGGETRIARRCNVQMMHLPPPAALPGAFPEFLDDMVGLMHQTNGYAQTIDMPDAFPDTFIADQSARLVDLQTDYLNANAQGQFVLDALATGLMRQGMTPGQSSRNLADITAIVAARDTRDEGSNAPRMFRPQLPRIMAPQSLVHKAKLPSIPALENAIDATLFEDQCPADMAELDKMLLLQFEGRFADRLEAKVLYSVSGALMSTSAEFAGAGLGSPLAGEYAGKAVAISYASYALYLGFLKGMMPAQLTHIDAEISNATIYEDQPDLRVVVENAVLVTKSEGWDVKKATLDAVVSLIGLKDGAGFVGRGISATNAPALATGLATKTIGARAVGSEGFKLAQKTFSDSFDSVTGIIDGELINFIYAQDQKSGSKGIQVPPQYCRVDMLDEDWAMIQLEDPDLIYERRAFGVYQPMRDGRATLTITPRPEGDRFSGVALPTFSADLFVPYLSAQRESSPGSVIPGSAFDVTATLLNSANEETQLFWEVAPSGVVSTNVSADSTTMTVQTTRQVRDFPVRGTISAVGNFLPQSEATDRETQFVVQAGGLWLVPSRSCISPGGEVQVFVFDARTEEPVPARDLVFHTDTAGIDVDGNGLVTSTKEDRDVIIYARGVGANGYRGQVKIRADCTCGIDYFNPKLVVPANTSGPLGITAQMGGSGSDFVSDGTNTVWVPRLPGMPDLFAIDGKINVVVSGDINLTYERPFALDLIAGQVAGAYGPTCSYLTGGISPVYLGTQMLLATPGGLSPAASDSDMSPDRFNAGGVGGVGFSLEDFGGPDDFGTVSAPGGVSASVAKLEPDAVVIELSGQFEGFKYIPFSQGLREDISVNIKTTFTSTPVD